MPSNDDLRHVGLELSHPRSGTGTLPAGSDRAILVAVRRALPASGRFQPPSGGVTPDGVAFKYAANDATVADLDADGEYEIILKWDPTNSKDAGISGYTGNTFIDAYKLDGVRL